MAEMVLASLVKKVSEREEEDTVNVAQRLDAERSKRERDHCSRALGRALVVGGTGAGV